MILTRNKFEEAKRMAIAAILFAIAALGGVIMALIRFSGRDYPPMALAIIHGLFAAAGLIALLVVVFGPGVAILARIAKTSRGTQSAMGSFGAVHKTM